MAPTVIRAVMHDMEIMRDITFNPVIPLMAYNTIEEAIARANDMAAGLFAAIIAGLIEAARAVDQKTDAGAISLMNGALTGPCFEASKQSFKAFRTWRVTDKADGFRRFFRQKAYIANTICPLTTTCPLTLKDFSKG